MKNGFPPCRSPIRENVRGNIGAGQLAVRKEGKCGDGHSHFGKLKIAGERFPENSAEYRKNVNRDYGSYENPASQCPAHYDVSN